MLKCGMRWNRAMFKPVLVFFFFKPKIKTLFQREQKLTRTTALQHVNSQLKISSYFLFSKSGTKWAFRIQKLFWCRIPQKTRNYTTAKCHARDGWGTNYKYLSLPLKTINKKPRLSHYIKTEIKARCYTLFPLQQMHALKCNFWQIAKCTSQEPAFKIFTRTPCSKQLVQQAEL